MAVQHDLERFFPAFSLLHQQLLQPVLLEVFMHMAVLAGAGAMKIDAQHLVKSPADFQAVAGTPGAARGYLVGVTPRAVPNPEGLRLGAYCLIQLPGAASPPPVPAQPAF